MDKIIALQNIKGGKWVAVLFENGESLTLDQETTIRAGLCKGCSIDQRKKQELVENADFMECYDAALHYLSYRLRSEVELRKYLMDKKNFKEVTTDRVVDKLKKLKLIDDVAFAKSWRDDRIRFYPRSRFLIRRELMQKGITGKTIDEITSGIDDEKNAYAIGLKRAKLLSSSSFEEFYRKLGGFLARRGYNREIVNTTVRRLWESRNAGAGECKDFND